MIPKNLRTSNKARDKITAMFTQNMTFFLVKLRCCFAFSLAVKSLSSVMHLVVCSAICSSDWLAAPSK